MITGEEFVYYGPEPWQSMWRNRHQLLRRLATANRVVYVEPRPYVDEVFAALRGRELRLVRPARWRDAAGGRTVVALRHAEVRGVGRAAADPRRDPLAAATTPDARLVTGGCAPAHPVDLHPGAVRCPVRSACPAAGVSHRGRLPGLRQPDRYATRLMGGARARADRLGRPGGGRLTGADGVQGGRQPEVSTVAERGG